MWAAAGSGASPGARPFPPHPALINTSARTQDAGPLRDTAGLGRRAHGRAGACCWWRSSPSTRSGGRSTRAPASSLPSSPHASSAWRTTATSWAELYFRDAAGTTLWFALVTVPLLVVLGVLVALLLNESFVGNAVLRVGMLLPWALPATVAGLIWKWIFLDSWGALNAGLYTTGLIDNYIAWLTTPGSGPDGGGGRLHLDPVAADRHLPAGGTAGHLQRALRRRRRRWRGRLRPLLEHHPARHPADAGHRHPLRSC